MPDGHDPVPSDLPRRLGFWGASAIMVGVIVGSGIFRTPAAIAGELGSPAIILALWLVGGALSLFGAFTYAELVTMYPQSGGVYVFLREGLGRCVAFVFGWTYMLITKPFAAAGIAMIGAEHINHLLGTGWDARATTSVILVALTAINTPGVRPGAWVAVGLTGIKVLALAAIVGLAVVLMEGSAENFVATPSPRPLWAALAPVMAGILWTYDGWSDVGSIAGEVREPQRLLPRIFVAGTLAVIALYLAVNAVYLWMVPLEEMRTTATLAPLVMGRLLGPAGGVAVTLLIIVSTIGSSHSAIITGARVTFAQARDGLLFGVLGRVHPVYRTPAVTLWVQCALSCAAVWVMGRFESLAGGFVFTMWIFYGLAAVTIFVLRARRPGAARPFRCPGYPVVPAVFILASAAMTGLAIAADPARTLGWLGVLAAGVPVYYVWSWWTRPAAQT